ncbi:hypothetical protein ES703_119895 [subsurface metagenome]
MQIKAYVTLTLKDTITGEVLKRKRWSSESFVLAFLDILYIQCARLTHDVKDIGGNIRATVYNSANFNQIYAAGIGDRGIVVGTGNTAVAIDDFKMEAQIVNGEGAGQLYHQAGQKIAPSTVGTRRHWYHSREFDNVSGGTITAKECGIYGMGASYKFCFIRDLIEGGAGQAVAHNQTMTIQYEYYVEV